METEVERDWVELSWGFPLFLWDMMCSECVFVAGLNKFAMGWLLPWNHRQFQPGPQIFRSPTFNHHLHPLTKFLPSSSFSRRCCCRKYLLRLQRLSLGATLHVRDHILLSRVTFLALWTLEDSLPLVLSQVGQQAGLAERFLTQRTWNLCASTFHGLSAVRQSLVEDQLRLGNCCERTRGAVELIFPIRGCFFFPLLGCWLPTLLVPHVATQFLR